MIWLSTVYLSHSLLRATLRNGLVSKKAWGLVNEIYADDFTSLGYDVRPVPDDAPDEASSSGSSSKSASKSASESSSESSSKSNALGREVPTRHTVDLTQRRG